MSAVHTSLSGLVKAGNWKALEDQWLSAVENGDDRRGEMLESLAGLAQAGRAEQASTLAWTWLSTFKEKASSADVLALGRELVVRCGDNEDMRKELLRLYEEVYADRPELQRLIEASGLKGGKSPRRALRTLEICLNLKEGDYLIARSDEHIAKVTGIDLDIPEYTIQGKRGAIDTLEPDALGLAYDPIAETDFRVLIQTNVPRIKELLNEDPVALVIGILQSHRGRLDSDQLEHVLVPQFLSQKEWSGWWTRAKTALKRSPNVMVEGRNPMILTYTAQGQTLEEEIEPVWSKAETPGQRLTAIDTYFREAKARGVQPKQHLIDRMQRDLNKRIAAAEKGSPFDALLEGLALDRLGEHAKLPAESTNVAYRILAEHADVVRLLSRVREPAFVVKALEKSKVALPDKWPDLFADLLPLAPVEGCEAIARALHAGGYRDKLDAALQKVPTDFTRHLHALCWMWRGSSVPNIEVMPTRELLLKLLEHLAELTRSDRTAANVLRDARQEIREAIGSGKFARYRQVIEGMEAGLASTVRRTVDRLDGLGQVVRSTMLKIIQETHPELYVKAKIDPWLDESIILGTQPGMSKREEELNFLVNVKMKENAKAIGEAAAHGDLSENSEYKFALEERDLLRARVAQIQNELSLARLLTEHDVSTDTVTVGTRVTLQSVDGVVRRDMTIMGPWEADIEKGIYNYRAPLSSKLRGLSVGDTAILDLDGKEREYRIEVIANGFLPA